MPPIVDAWADRRIARTGDGPSSGSAPVVAHYDATNGNLRFARCHDAACAVRNGALATLDGSRDVGQRTSIAIGLDGVAVVAYDDATHEMVKIARPAILR